MWRNADVLNFISWLRDYNDQLPPGATKTGFYGLDLYSLNRSMQEVVRYLDRVDPEAAKRARQRYACFDQYGDDSEAYAYGAALGMNKSCEDEVVKQLTELQQQMPQYARRDGQAAEDAAFQAEQMPAWRRTRRNTTEQWSAAASPLGTCATPIWWKRSTPSSPTSIAGTKEKIRRPPRQRRP